MTTTERPTTEAGPMCPVGCGCQLWTEDADRRDCACDGPCCWYSWDDYLADVLERPDYYREIFNASRDRQIALPAEPTAPTLDFDSASALLSAYNYWLHDHPDASVGDRYDWTKRYLARLASERGGGDA